MLRVQWNAEIRTSDNWTTPKSKQNGLPFPEVRISDIRTRSNDYFIQISDILASLDHFIKKLYIYKMV